MYKVIVEWPDGRTASTGGIHEYNDAEALAKLMGTLGTKSVTIEPEEA